ncbi:Six-hairpin glycosidase [Corynespora cassiicola Philippines]|uniref:Six-hairpin glycosidase n=1 Tax=Corynespora cassiicola Philippines TaxID=1448308 RepID=A0A2T2P709_CORCC|nr:Six-hairpin glycosidase [Corynespora cassiicola Philippines]
MGGSTIEVKKAAKAASVKGVDLTPVFSENVAAKVFQVAERGLKVHAPLPTYPHTVPQDGPDAGRYEEREADFWTCGFFPGCIYSILERAIKFPRALDIPEYIRPQFAQHLLKQGRHWSVAINQMSGRTDTHDMGFIVQPALQKDWELTGNPESLQSVVKAAYALASRWNDKVKAIRSWDVAINDRYQITDMSTDFLVIIDSMCNLDLLYWVGHNQNDQSLIDIATQHADTIMAAILRADYSSYHLVNFDPHTGALKAQMTNQGEFDESTWSRGQAWAVMGFAQTYSWTKDTKYLATAIKCAQYFLKRLEEAKGKHHHPLVPVWDFDAPQENPQEPIRDVSAGVVTANGLLMIHQSLQALPSSVASQLLDPSIDLFDTSLQIMKETIDMSYDRDLASFEAPPAKIANGVGSGDLIKLKQSGFDAILRNSTTNKNPDAHQKYWDHGLVYADYYFLEFGNKVLRAGLV